MLRPFVRPMLGIPLPDEEIFDSVQHLFNQLKRIRTILTDPKEASIRLVVNPEKMVIKEAQRTFTYLNLYGYFTDLIICNHLIPDEVEDHYFHSWKGSQSRYYQVIEECFSPLPVFTVPLLEQEVVGLPMLRLIAQSLYGEKDPTKVFFQGQANEIQKEDGYYVLNLALPFTTKEQVSLMHGNGRKILEVEHTPGEELVIRFRAPKLLPASQRLKEQEGSYWWRFVASLMLVLSH